MAKLKWDRGAAGGLDHPSPAARPLVVITDHQKAVLGKARRIEAQERGAAIRKAEMPAKLAALSARIDRKRPE